MSARPVRRRPLRLVLPLCAAGLAAAVAVYRQRQLADSARAFADRYGDRDDT